MIGEAMREIDPDELDSRVADTPAESVATLQDEQDRVPVPPVADRRFEGLDLRYHSVLAELLTRGLWTKGDFEDLVRRHSLMPSGTLDVINEWSQEQLDDLIVEEQSNGLNVNCSLIAERP
jgi:hypothetical protein